MATYRQPRRLNSVSALFLLAFLAAGYWMWIFFPAYWDAWTVDHQLREAVASLYKLSLLTEPGRSAEMRKVLKKVQADAIRLANIKDPNFDVSLDMEGTAVILKADYDVEVRHPFGNFVTKVHMARVEKSNIKRVSWD